MGEYPLLQLKHMRGKVGEKNIGFQAAIVATDQTRYIMRYFSKLHSETHDHPSVGPLVPHVWDTVSQATQYSDVFSQAQ